VGLYHLCTGMMKQKRDALDFVGAFHLFSFKPEVYSSTEICPAYLYVVASSTQLSSSSSAAVLGSFRAFIGQIKSLPAASFTSMYLFTYFIVKVAQLLNLTTRSG
jgi:hypothetical protein